MRDSTANALGVRSRAARDLLAGLPVTLLFLPETHTFSHTSSPIAIVAALSSMKFSLTLVLLLLLQPLVLFSGTTIVIRPTLDSSSVRLTGLPFNFAKRPRIGLVLSGGGARGATQIGVLKAFERHSIPIDFIAATSMGAIVGGLYASGYTAEEIESIALTTNWDEVLSLTEDTKRTDLFVDQKLQRDRSFLVIRFEGLQPVIPEALSSGQRLTNFLSTHTLQALYQPHPTFDDLKVRFRAVTTDLISGRRVVLDRGSLAEALRASATVPLVFTPLKKDSMQLIDGGLVSNIPVDVARDAGCDIVVAVNSMSGLRGADELKAPWQTADQIMGIMMQQPSREAMKEADVVITPTIGKHISSDFTGLDSLIVQGQRAAEQVIDSILRLYIVKTDSVEANPRLGLHLSHPDVAISDTGLPEAVRTRVVKLSSSNSVDESDIRECTRQILDVGDYRDVFAEVHIDSQVVGELNGAPHARIQYHCTRNPVIRSVSFQGFSVIDTGKLQSAVAPLIGFPLNAHTLQKAREDVLRLYRDGGYSLARITSVAFEEGSGIISFRMNEGVIGNIEVQGGERAQDEFVLREFPLRPGDVFQVQKADEGITNINSTTLFEYVYLEVSYEHPDPVLTIRIKERPSQLVRLGLRADDERNLQGLIDIRDENFRGLGMELGLNLNGGGRNKAALLEFKAHRLFRTYLTFNINTFVSYYDSYLYADAPSQEHNRWDRTRIGEYRDNRYGGHVIFGTQLEKLGNATVDFSLQDVWIRNLEQAEALQDRYRLSMVRIGTVIDTKDSYPFPVTGFDVNMSYEFAFAGLGSQVGYNALRIKYESFSTWGTRHTFHPRILFGFADRTMPLGEQFRLGGREMMYGTNEDDRRGRQILLVNLQYRYRLPVRILFESYLGFRFDMGSISAVQEDIKFATLRYGIGAELSLDTPVGPAIFALGKSFYFGRNLPENPLQLGPFMAYFMIGYQL